MDSQGILVLLAEQHPSRYITVEPVGKTYLLLVCCSLVVRIGQVIHSQSDDFVACCLLSTLWPFMFMAFMYQCPMSGLSCIIAQCQGARLYYCFLSGRSSCISSPCATWLYHTGKLVHSRCWIKHSGLF